MLSGLYGMAHNQISYTVSSEYFTKFKFQQFNIESINLPDRVRAAEVGFLASWWMGIPIGLLVGGCGFIHSNHWQMLKFSLISFGLVILITLCIGLGGLIYGCMETRSINPADYKGWHIPDGVVHLRRFLCAGYMHNASYLGGTISIYAACAFQVVAKIKTAVGITAHEHPSGNSYR